MAENILVDVQSYTRNWDGKWVVSTPPYRLEMDILRGQKEGELWCDDRI